MKLSKKERDKQLARARKTVGEVNGKTLDALAKTGLEALIDEATGFQKVRPKGALKKRFKVHKDEAENDVEDDAADLRVRLEHDA